MQEAAEAGEPVAMTEGARLLEEELARRKWSQTTLSERLGLSKGHVSKWLSGDRRPSLRWAVEIERLVGVPHEAWLIEAGSRSAG